MSTVLELGLPEAAAYLKEVYPRRKWLLFASRTRASIAALPITRPDKCTAAPLRACFFLSGRAKGPFAHTVSK
jgi:hypothetical protein